MARTAQWELPEMAEGDSSPAWPLSGVAPKFALWSFGGGRPFGCKEPSCERWHAGVDLTGAQDRTIVVAPESGQIVAVDRGWSGASKAVDLRTDTGLFVVLGGFIEGSPAEFGVKAGTRVSKGQKLGRVLGSYGMIHLETYTADPDRTTNSPWWKGKPPPEGILNPTNYVERAAGRRPSLLRASQRHGALAALGFFKGSLGASWGGPSEAALRAAQAALGVAVDGVWGPATEAAIMAALPDYEIEPESAPERGRAGLWIGLGIGAVGIVAGVAWYARRQST